MLGVVQRRRGDYPQSRADFARALTLFYRDLGVTQYIPYCLEGMAAIAMADGPPLRTHGCSVPRRLYTKRSSP